MADSVLVSTPAFALDSIETHGFCTKTLHQTKVVLLWSAACCIAAKQVVTCLTIQLLATTLAILRTGLSQRFAASSYVLSSTDVLCTETTPGFGQTFQLSSEPSDDEQPSVVHWWQPPLLLPPQLPRHRGKLTIVLDLDETLVCTYREVNVPPELLSQAAFKLQCTAGPSSAGHVVVFLRPGLGEFLRRAAEMAELVVFTAGLPSYASPLLDKLDPEGVLFAARLYRNSTVASPCGRKHVKDLSRLGRPLSRTLLVDNNPTSFLAQPNNGVPIDSYRGDPADCQLLGALLPLLEVLNQAPDVRPHLRDLFGVADWLAVRPATIGCKSRRRSLTKN